MVDKYENFILFEVDFHFSYLMCCANANVPPKTLSFYVYEEEIQTLHVKLPFLDTFLEKTRLANGHVIYKLILKKQSPPSTQSQL